MLVESSGQCLSPVTTPAIPLRPQRRGDEARLIVAARDTRGFVASARSCARRSFAAETIFMALVICRVLITLRMRRLMSRMLAIENLPSAISRQLSVKSFGL
jgi:hypothetical protein